LSDRLKVFVMPRITTFLMFTGNAEEALTFYLSLFPGSAITSISRYDDAGPGPAGTVQHAIWTRTPSARSMDG
jgi:predicted 3-demethylubiquinone-9 3-methyltransferase (glyoxalase superfamily)